MKLKVKDLRKIIKEFTGSLYGVNTSAPRYERSDIRAVNLSDIISNDLQEFSRLIMRAAIMEDTYNNATPGSEIDKNSPAFETQLDMASKDFYARLNVAVGRKIASIAREVLVNFKDGKYSEATEITSLKGMY